MRPEITKAQIQEALWAEGASAGSGWTGVMYRQKLWSVPENMYRIASSECAEKIIPNRLMASTLNWLMLSEEETELYCQAFEKVMAAYSK